MIIIYRNGYWFQIDPERPFLRFLGGGGKKVDLPPVSDPIPTPEDVDIQAMQKGEAARRQIRSRRGRAGTILTTAESTLGTTTIAKSPILGVVGGA